MDLGYANGQGAGQKVKNSVFPLSAIPSLLAEALQPLSASIPAKRQHFETNELAVTTLNAHFTPERQWQEHHQRELPAPTGPQSHCFQIQTRLCNSTFGFPSSRSGKLQL